MMYYHGILTMGLLGGNMYEVAGGSETRPGGLCPYLSICKVGRLDVAALQVVDASMARFGAGAHPGAAVSSST